MLGISRRYHYRYMFSFMIKMKHKSEKNVVPAFLYFFLLSELGKRWSGLLANDKTSSIFLFIENFFFLILQNSYKFSTNLEYSEIHESWCNIIELFLLFTIIKVLWKLSWSKSVCKYWEIFLYAHFLHKFISVLFCNYVMMVFDQVEDFFMKI